MQRLMIWALTLLGIAALPVRAAELRGAAGVVDITPPLGVQLGGYQELRPDRPAKGIRDPLTARILVLSDGRNTAAFVVADLIGTFATAEMSQLRAGVKEKAGIDWLFFSVTHSHSAPDMQEEYPGGKFPAWEQEDIGKIVAGIAETSRRLEPVRLGSGWGQSDIGHDRRFVQADGSIRMLWRNSTRTVTYPIDTTVGVLRVDNARGEPLAILVNYACHPVVFTADNDFYSADWPGAMRRYVENNVAGSPICFFLQGAAGNINPYYDKTYLDEHSVEMVRRTGERLGREVVRIARQIQTASPAEPQVACLTDTQHFKLRWDPKAVRKALAAVLTADHVGQSMRNLRTEFDVPVSSCVLNREVALSAFPGEFFVEFQQTLRSRSPLRDAFFLGYTNGYFGYFPTIRAAAAGGYGASDFSVFLEPGAGERLVDGALIQIYRLLGKLKDQPETAGD